MNDEKLIELLNKLSETTAEPVNPELCEKLKSQIPAKFGIHRLGMDTINIVIDLRVGKLTAAAAIIFTVILWTGFISERVSPAGIYNDGKLLIAYCLGSADKSGIAACRARYEYLLSKGKQAAYYGRTANTKDSNDVLLCWKLADGNYRVTFGDLREKTVNAEELIRLQSMTLQKK